MIISTKNEIVSKSKLFSSFLFTNAGYLRCYDAFLKDKTTKTYIKPMSYSFLV